MSVFFITLPGDMYEIMLPLMQKCHENGDEPIVFTLPEFYPFFVKYTNFETFCIDCDINKSIFKIKSIYYSLLRGIKNQDIYFYSASWTLGIFYFLKKLQKNNKIIFCRSTKNPNPDPFKDMLYPLDNTFRAKLMKLFAKLFFGLNLDIINKQNKLVWKLNKNTIPCFIKRLYDPKDLSGIFKIDTEFLKGRDTLLLIGDEVTESADVESFTDMSTGVYCILERHHYFIKPHPRECKLYGMLAKSNHILDKYIMAELLFNYEWKVILGLFSLSLINAKNMTNAKVISLMDLYEWGDKKLRNYWYKRISENDIPIPKSFEELEGMLSEVKYC